MKKVTSILLLLLMLFNLFGYKLWSSFMQDEASTQLETQLDNSNYDESQLISIKIPVTYLCYYNNSKSFERTEGQIEIEGVPYKYVKRRIFNDSLEMLCIPNQTVMKLKASENEFFKFVNGLQHTGEGKTADSHPVTCKIFVLDCYITTDLFKISDHLHRIERITPPYFAAISPSHCLIVEHPPDNC